MDKPTRVFARMEHERSYGLFTEDGGRFIGSDCELVFADDMDDYLRDEVLPVLRETREWIGELRTGDAKIAVVARYDVDRVDRLIREIEGGGK